MRKRPSDAAVAGNRWAMLAAVSLATFMLLLDLTVVNVALPHIQRSFRADFATLQWVIDAYSLTLASFLLTAGSLADRLGRKRMFVLGLGVFMAASALCGAAPTATTLNVARGLQGIGGAIMYAVAPALISHDFHGKERGLAFAIFGGVGGMGIATGPLIGGALTAIGWQWIFLVNIPVGVVAILASLGVRESRDAGGGRADALGVIVFCAALGTLILGLIRSSEDGWTSTLVLILLAGAAAMFALFVAVERRQEHPMLDLGLFRKRAFLGLSTSTLLGNAAGNVTVLFVSVYLQQILGFSALGTGVRVLPLTAALFVGAVVGGTLSVRIPARVLLSAALALQGVGLLLICGIDARSGWKALLPGFIVAGFGIGAFNPPRASAAVALAPPERAGMAAGTNETFQQTGVALGVAAIGSIGATRIRDAFAAQFPRLHGSAHAAGVIASGGVTDAIRAVRPEMRQAAAAAAHGAFVEGLTTVAAVTGATALVAAVIALVLIRARDFRTPMVPYPDAVPAGLDERRVASR